MPPLESFITVRAVKGRRVRDPETKRVVPAEGVRVPDSMYWRRALREGDVELVPEAPAKPAPKSAPKRAED